MNIGAITCFIMAGFFLALTIVFSVLKEKGTILISGFNTLPKEQQERYDKVRMSRDFRKYLVYNLLVLIICGLLSLFISGYFVFAAFGAFSVLFFMNVHLDAKRAFDKYKL